METINIYAKILLAISLVLTLFEPIAQGGISAKTVESRIVYSAFKIKINDKLLNLPGYYITDTSKKQSLSIRYVPLKVVAEALGAKVSNTFENPVIVTFDSTVDHRMSFTIDSSRVTLDGIKTVMEGIARIKDGVLLVPLNFLTKGISFEIEPPKMGSNDNIAVLTSVKEEVINDDIFYPKKQEVKIDKEWKPYGRQIVIGKEFFSKIKWSPSTRTITLNLPATITYEGKVYTVQVAFAQGMERPIEIVTGKEVILTNLSDAFQMQITAMNENLRAFDTYSLRTEYFQYNNIDESRGLTDKLLVHDYYSQFTDLETVYKSFGINN